MDSQRTITHDGKTASCACLYIRDLLPIAAEIKAEEERNAKSLADECKLSPYERYNVLAQIRGSRPTVHEVYEYAHTPQGAFEVVKRSLLKGGCAKEDVGGFIDSLVTADVVDLAKTLVLNPPLAKPNTPDGTKEGEGNFLSPSGTDSPSPLTA